ncbi:class I SAM-dependent methyltransferase [Salipaludibacillus daqingensis]|uniref:class I SAM-dependent methyltransferase n=1 Tax=Salipaludibacillus daqingensis TaxID=3041001 RepID=UPI0024745940|nr:class I SAM-dependent methyltransferase [Salipaludibacillus daqingensis]
MKKYINDNLDEYNDPVLYDKENEPFQQDIALILKWASRVKGTIIDLACGTGRATIPLANKGYNVIGVDLEKKMLDEAIKKSLKQNLSIDFIQQDCTQLHLNIKSHFIYSIGNSFQHFLTNHAQDKFLESVNKHLVMGGIFIFGTRFPSEDELVESSENKYWRTYEDSETKYKVEVYLKSEYDSITQLQHNETTRRFINNEGNIIKESKTELSLRYVFPKEMERLLNSSGFEIVHVYGDWNETPLTNASNEMIYICKKIAK